MYYVLCSYSEVSWSIESVIKKIIRKRKYFYSIVLYLPPQKSVYKWICTVQTCVVSESTVFDFPYSVLPLLYSLPISLVVSFFSICALLFLLWNVHIIQGSILSPFLFYTELRISLNTYVFVVSNPHLPLPQVPDLYLQLLTEHP